MLAKIVEGDCLDLIPTLEDASINLVVTDPPYNIAKDTTVVEFPDKRYSSYLNEAEWDIFSSKSGFLQWMMKWASILYPKMKKNSSMYVFCADKFISYIGDLYQSIGFEWAKTITWYKVNAAPRCFKTSFSTAAEYILYFRKGKPTFNWQGELLTRNVITCPMCKNSERWGHPTQKPEWLISHLIKISSNENDLVLDPFGGVGTTAKCCLDLKRRNISFEINPDYVKKAKKRLEAAQPPFNIFCI